MTTQSLSSLTSAQLVEQFLSLAIARGEAITGDRNAEANRLFGKIDAVEAEMKGRDGDQRRLLTVLYDHRNAQVRMEAAMATLAVFPEQARGVLQAIKDRQEFPFSGEAGLTLLYLDLGQFKPS